jgi:hypothetical protein
VDKLGTAYSDPVVCTGYGSMLATPMIRKAVDDKAQLGLKMNEQEAKDLLEECIKVMYYRDARAFNKVSELFNTWHCMGNFVHFLCVICCNFCNFVCSTKLLLYQLTDGLLELKDLSKSKEIGRWLILFST